MKPKKASMRPQVLKTLEPPYICFFCGEEITDLTSNGRESFNTHHIDENHENNDPSNWAASHKRCHASYHMKTAFRTDSWRARISESMLGNTNGKYGRRGKYK